MLTLTAAIWGSSWVGAGILSRAGVPPIYSSLGRFVFGSLGLLLILWRAGNWPRPERAVWLRLLAMGFFGVFTYNICFFNGLATVPAGRASLMATLQPSLVFVYSCVFWGERPGVGKVSGLLLSLLGAGLVLTQADPEKLFRTGLGSGDLWILGTVLSWVAYTLIGRNLMGKIGALPATAYAIWAGLLMLVAYAVVVQEALPDFGQLSYWAITAYIGLLGTTLAFLLFLRGIEQLGAAKASIFINLVPVFSVITSNLVTGEAVTWPTLVGGAMAMMGVRLLTQSRT